MMHKVILWVSTEYTTYSNKDNRTRCYIYRRPTSVVAPNVGDYQESVKKILQNHQRARVVLLHQQGRVPQAEVVEDFTQPNLTPQQQTERFDAMVQSEMDKMPTGALVFNNKTLRTM